MTSSPPSTTFSTTLAGDDGKTGIVVPPEAIAALGAGKRPPVVVTVGGHTYRSTIAPMGGASWIPLAAEHREAAGLSAGDEVDVIVEHDPAPREVALHARCCSAQPAPRGSCTWRASACACRKRSSAERRSQAK